MKKQENDFVQVLIASAIFFLFLPGCQKENLGGELSEPDGASLATEVISDSPPLIQSIEPDPQETNSPEPSIESDQNGRLYIFSPFSGYFISEQNEQTNVFSNPFPIDGFDSAANGKLGPGASKELSFSHFSGMIAYLTYPNETVPYQLWLADIEFENPVLVFSDDKRIFETIEFFDLSIMWTADDKHIIVDIVDNSQLDFIYSLDTKAISPWPYDCDRVSWSPISDRLATWCSDDDNDNKFAVIEWGGDVWYSDFPPERTLVKRTVPPARYWKSDQSWVWGWSDDGEMIAFYNSEDDNGSLQIANSLGEIILVGPAAAYWNVDSDPAGLPPIFPIKWSSDRTRILFYGSGTTDKDCPTWINIFDPAMTENQIVPCWQIFDVQRQEIIWSLSDLTRMASINPDTVSNFSFSFASLSSDGKILSIGSSVGGTFDLKVIEVETSELLGTWDIQATIFELK